MYRRSTLLALLALLALASPPAATAPVVVSTLGSWDGSSSIGDFGSSGFSSFGQSVLAPVGTNRLTSFTFELSDAIQGSFSTPNGIVPGVPVPVQFHANVVQFNPANRTIFGPVLYASDVITVPLTDALAFSAYTFSPDIAVTSGASYLLFLFADNYTLDAPNDSRLRLGSSNTNVYAGGGYAYHFPADGDFNSLFTGSWTGGTVAFPDLAFSATFDQVDVAAVSEPGTLAALALGLAMLGAARRRQGG